MNTAITTATNTERLRTPSRRFGIRVSGGACPAATARNTLQSVMVNRKVEFRGKP